MPNCIRELRRQRGLTQVQLAAALEVNEITIVRWEKGYSPISRQSLAKIAQFFQVAQTDIEPDLALVPTPEETAHA